MKIAVAGTGYVGLSIATLLAQRHQVIAVDVVSSEDVDAQVESAKQDQLVAGNTIES